MSLIEDFERKIRYLEDDGDVVVDLEESRIEVLSKRESSIHQLRKMIDKQFSVELNDWAKSYSHRWKQIQKVLLEAGETTPVNAIPNKELKEFSTYIKQGLIPLWTERTHKPNKEYFYDFTEDNFIRLLDERDEIKKITVDFSVTGLDSYNRTLIGDKIVLENLVPNRFTNKLISYLQQL